MATGEKKYGVSTAPVRRPAGLGAMVLQIANQVPRMRAAYQEESDFWSWFAGEVDSVRRNAASAEEAERLVDLLKRAAGTAVTS